MTMECGAVDSASTPQIVACDSDRGNISTWNRISNVLGNLLFFGCWMVFGSIISLWLTNEGYSMFISVALALVGGFVAAVLAWTLGGAGVTFEINDTKANGQLTETLRT